MFYTHGSLDRADRLRRDAAALADMRRAPSTRLVPVWRGTVLITRPEGHAGPRLASLRHDAIDDDEAFAGEPIFLGLIDEAAYFALPLAASDERVGTSLATRATAIDGTALAAEFADLRRVGPTLPADEGALLAYARGLSWWQEQARFCERCGHPLTSTDGGHVRRCGHPHEPHSTFPRTDPAVIMLVVDEPRDGAPPRCLLGRSPAWPEGVFSTLAGFVEPGESLEQAVSREVFEESGIETRDVRYVASQPWPFPRSIMLGFEAVASSTTIHIDPHELADARWFTRAELATFGNWGDERHALQLPRPDSIARFLIERWMARGG